MDKESIYSIWTFFIIHAVIAATTCFFFLIINLLTYPKALWFHIPLLAWAFILVLHYYFNILYINGVFKNLSNQLIERLNASNKNIPKN